MNPNMPPASVRVGAGGEGAKQENPHEDKNKNTPLSDKVGEMAEESARQQERQQSGKSEKFVRRELEYNEDDDDDEDDEDEDEEDGGETSGTVLRERREDEAPNPKKRMWEEPVAQGGRDEGRRERDEL